MTTGTLKRLAESKGFISHPTSKSIETYWKSTKTIGNQSEYKEILGNIERESE